MTSICDNLNRVLLSIREAERQAGRAPGSVSLIAVSKFHSVEDVLEAVAAGQTSFGENRVQEVVAKFTEVKSRLSGSPSAPISGSLSSEAYRNVPLSLHIIGTLQSNKIGKAVAIADMIESVDSIDHLTQIEKQCAKLGKTIRVLFELHTGEESKSGFPSVDDIRRVLALCAEGKMPHVVPSGFMTMAPLTSDESVQRASFAALRTAQETLCQEFPSLPLGTLSMGMSADYRAAIMEGSTEVRIGTAIFGPRPAQ